MLCSPVTMLTYLVYPVMTFFHVCFFSASEELLAIPNDLARPPWITGVIRVIYQVRIQLLLGIAASSAPERSSTKQLITNVSEKYSSFSGFSHDLIIAHYLF